MTRRRPGALAIFGALGIVGATSGHPAHAAGERQRYEYRVEEATYGDIGTYGFIVEKTGNTLVISTEGHLKVTVLGVTMYRQEVARRERWIDGRLMEFHGVTTENGKPVTVEGRAEGDRFLLRSAAGDVVAPAAIRPVSPWAAGLPGTTMFMPDSGAVTTVRVEEGGETQVTVGGRSVPVRRYRIETAGGQERYEVLLDRAGIPQRFSIKDADSDATFTLAKDVPAK